MTAPRELEKDDFHDLVTGGGGPVAMYRDFFVGRPGLWNLVRYEAAQIASAMPGAPGYALRRMLLGGLLGSVGSKVNFGRNVSIRHPGKISIGDRTGIDDGCLLDARGVQRGEFTIGSDVMIARGASLAARTPEAAITIGDHTTIGKAVQIASTGGVRIGSWVAVSGMCYLGGGLYHTDDLDTPIMKQGLYSRGPVVIGDDCWLGAGVIVLDGVEVGAGCVISAGVVVRENVPPGTMVMARDRVVLVPRGVTGTGSHEPDAPSGAPTASDRAGEGPSAVSDRGAAPVDPVERCLYRALESVNRTRPAGARLSPAPETPLAGPGGLDSLGLVTLVVETELAIEEELGVAIDLSTGAMTADPTPLATVGTLAAYIRERLGSG